MGQRSWAAEGSIDASVSLGNGTKASAGATLRCAAVAGLISSSKRELLLKAVELLETRIKIFGDAFFEKAFPSVRAPLNHRGNPVRFSRADVPPLRLI